MNTKLKIVKIDTFDGDDLDDREYYDIDFISLTELEKYRNTGGSDNKQLLQEIADLIPTHLPVKEGSSIE